MFYRSYSFIDFSFKMLYLLLTIKINIQLCLEDTLVKYNLLHLDLLDIMLIK